MNIIRCCNKKSRIYSKIRLYIGSNEERTGNSIWISDDKTILKRINVPVSFLELIIGFKRLYYSIQLKDENMEDNQGICLAIFLNRKIKWQNTYS